MTYCRMYIDTVSTTLTVTGKNLTYLDFCRSAQFPDTASQREEPRFDPEEEKVPLLNSVYPIRVKGSLDAHSANFFKIIAAYGNF